MTSLPPGVTPQAAPSGERLTTMYEKRKALSHAVDADIAAGGEMTEAREKRLYDQMKEIDEMDARIRVQAMKDERSGGGIVLGTGRPVQEQRDQFTEWATRGYRQGGYELRTVSVSTLGGATDVGTSEFIRVFERDSRIGSLARTVAVSSLAPVVYYRQSAQMGTLGVVAENGAATARDPAAEKVTLTPTKTAAYTDVSVETLATLPYDVVSDLQVQHAEAHAASWEAAFGGASATITGVQKITDTTASVGNAVSSTAGGVTGEITPAEALGIIYSATMKTSYLASAVWLVHPTCWAAIAGQASTSVYIFGGGQGNSIARDGAGMTYMGYPVYTSTGFSAPGGTNLYGVFGSVSQGYRIHRYSGVQFSADPYTLAVNGQVRYTSMVFADAAIVDRNAMVTLASA